MTKLPTIASLLLMLLSSAVRADEAPKGATNREIPLASRAEVRASQSKDAWFGADKFEHFFVSAMMSGFVFFNAREPLSRSENTSLAIGSSLAVGAGIGKEYLDSRRSKGVASWKDLIADLLGVGLTIFIIKVT